MILKMHNYSLSRLTKPFGNNLRPFFIYSGQIPTVDKDFVFNPANFADRQLAKVSQTLTGSTSEANLTFAAAPTQFTPTKTGTATWFAVCFADTAAGYPIAFIGTITDNSSANDPLLISAVNLVTGEVQSLIDFKFKLGA